MMYNSDLKLDISGIELSRGFYQDCGKPILELYLKNYMDQITVGLVGEGSECFGFDDKLSMDHDYGPSFCIWLSKELYEQIGAFVTEMYESLPGEYKNVSFQVKRRMAVGRRGVLQTEAFYQQFLGSGTLPQSSMEWLRIPESYLAVATNGELFHAPDTDFVRIRKYLKGFYPEDVRRKKIAANLVRMAHSGQVNFSRMACRQDAVASRMALDQFIEATIKVLYLLNRRYCPYYKWMWRGLEALHVDSNIISDLSALAYGDLRGTGSVANTVEKICNSVIHMLHQQELSKSEDDYMERQAFSVVEGITDAQLQGLPILMG